MFRNTTQKSGSNKLMAAADAIAEALRSYEKAALENETTGPDPELVEAQRKLEAARKIVMDGRLGYALVRQLVEHTKYWPSWIKRQDFSSYVDFDAADITAEENDTKDDGRQIKTKSIKFRFDGKEYGCVFRDEGYSSAPDSSFKFGQAEFWSDGVIVLKVSASLNLEHEYSNWEADDVMAFKPGPWMQDLLKISAEIEQRHSRRLQKFNEDRIREAGANIELP